MGQSLVNLVHHEMRLQWRNGIYIAYAFVLVTYILLLQFLAPQLPNWVPALIIYTDPVVLGFFFLGALMMLEKSEGVRAALAITPMRAADYYWAKVISLTIISVAAAIILGLFLHASINWPFYLGATLLISFTYTSISFPIALHFKTATSYLMGAAALLTPIVTPLFLALLDPLPFWAILIPATAQFRMMLVALGVFQASIFDLVSMISICILSALLSAWLGLRALKGEFGQK